MSSDNAQTFVESFRAEVGETDLRGVELVQLRAELTAARDETHKLKSNLAEQCEIARCRACEIERLRESLDKALEIGTAFRLQLDTIRTGVRTWIVYAPVGTRTEALERLIGD